MTSNLPHQRTLSFPCKLVRPNASQTLMLLGSLAGKNRKILSRKQGPGPAAATEVLTNSKQDAQHTKTQKPSQLKLCSRIKGKPSQLKDLRPHRVSACPHMFVCLFSSRIWSTCGFWAGTVWFILGIFRGSALFSFFEVDFVQDQP